MFDDLRDLYQEVILDHGKHPRNFGPLEAPTHVAHGDNPMCGDSINVYLILDDEGRVKDAHFDGKGCAISTASASMMTDIIKGKPLDEVQALFSAFHAMCTGKEEELPENVDHDALDRLQVLAGVKEFPMRVKCATLAWHTMTAALEGGGTVSTEEDE